MEKEMVTFVLISVFGLLGGLVGEFGFDQHCIIGSIIGAVIGLIFRFTSGEAAGGLADSIGDFAGD
jgi:hypothetical protein